MDFERADCGRTRLCQHLRLPKRNGQEQGRRGQQKPPALRDCPFRDLEPGFHMLPHSGVGRTEKTTGHGIPHFSQCDAYIWFGVPSDHTPVGIRNILIGSGLPLYDGANKSGDPGNVSDRLFEESTTFAPHTVPSGV
jgi:hypothetical protein